MRTGLTLAHGALGLMLLLGVACSSGGPQTGSQTNWLKSCQTSEECGEFACLCGTCTVSCEQDQNCGEGGAAVCVASTDRGAVAACDGNPPQRGMCLPSCDEGSCPQGASCVAGVCTASREATVQISVDPSNRYQTLIGFGASLAYDEDFLVQHPDKTELFDAMFSEAGFNVIRIGNRFEGDNLDDLKAADEIITEAAVRLGRRPSLFMTSGSPPASLKANDNRYCSNSDVDCTLARGTDGEFDYAGFAEHWRASLQAYETVGIHPEFVSIQSNADFLPDSEPAVEACRFLPREGVAPVTLLDGSTVDAEFAGYEEALGAVADAVDALPGEYSFSGPESGSAVMAPLYSDVLMRADSLAFHLYGMDADNVIVEQLEGVRVVGEELEFPILQTEMAAGGMDTAILAHHTLVHAGASAYLQQKFISQTMDEASFALIGVEGGEVRTMPPFHALAHFARHTDSGWQRVDATSDSVDVLSSAWRDPDGTALTVILVNVGGAAADIKLEVPDSISELMNEAAVTRTTFDGIERSADLGQLSEDRVVRVPPRSIVTIASSGI